MKKLDYERKPVGKSGGGAGLAGLTSDTRRPLIALGVGVAILFVAAFVYAGGIGTKGCVFFALVLLVAGVKAIGEIVAGFLAALVVKTELGTISNACLKLGSISVLCMGLSAPFGFSGLSIIVTTPIRWVLLMFFLDIEMVDAIVFTVASGIVLFVISMFLSATVPK